MTTTTAPAPETAPAPAAATAAIDPAVLAAAVAAELDRRDAETKAARAKADGGRSARADRVRDFIRTHRGHNTATQDAALQLLDAMEAADGVECCGLNRHRHIPPKLDRGGWPLTTCNGAIVTLNPNADCWQDDGAIRPGVRVQVR